MRALISLFFASPRRTLGWMAVAIVGMLSFGLYLQYHVGLTPCPMCIVQRYLYILIFLVALGGVFSRRCGVQAAVLTLVLVLAGSGAFVAARQTWLQWHPPAFYSCGRDFYGLIEQMPLSQALPKIFAGSGDCTAIDWTFLGGSIANWSLLAYTLMALVALGWLWRLWMRRGMCRA